MWLLITGKLKLIAASLASKRVPKLSLFLKSSVSANLLCDLYLARTRLAAAHQGSIHTQARLRMGRAATEHPPPARVGSAIHPSGLREAYI